MARPKSPARLIVADSSKNYAAYVAADSPQAICQYWEDYIIPDPLIPNDNENLIVLHLNTRLQCFAHSVISQGTINEAIAHPRDIFRPVIIQGSYAFVLMHNHPSGDPAPSRADRELTRRVAESAALLQVQFLDHVIYGGNTKLPSKYFSFAEAGLI